MFIPTARPVYAWIYVGVGVCVCVCLRGYPKPYTIAAQSIIWGRFWGRRETGFMWWVSILFANSWSKLPTPLPPSPNQILGEVRCMTIYRDLLYSSFVFGPEVDRDTK